MVFTDEFAFVSAPSSLEQIFISLANPTLAAAEVRWSGERASVTLTYDAQRFSAMLEKIPTHTHEHVAFVVWRVRLAGKGIRAEEKWKFGFTVSDRADRQEALS